MEANHEVLHHFLSFIPLLLHLSFIVVYLFSIFILGKLNFTPIQNRDKNGVSYTLNFSFGYKTEIHDSLNRVYSVERAITIRSVISCR
jgi:hypothetical protein